MKKSNQITSKMEENKNVESSSSVDAKMPEVDDSVTMVDVLKAEEDLEADSTAVLGGSDEKACTYYLVIVFVTFWGLPLMFSNFRATLSAKLSTPA